MHIALIGTGNLATHLAFALSKCTQVCVGQWIGRTPTPSKKINSVPYFDSFQENIDVDICIVAVSDDAVKKVAAKLAKTKALVVHTAGALSKNVLSPIQRKGVFYPLQSFLKDTAVSWNEIPICLEADNKSDLRLLHELATYLTAEIHHIDEQQRLKLHTAAVFANNFGNHLLGISQHLVADAKLPSSILKPLVTETFKRSFLNHPFETQTGPAKRNDMTSQKKHLTVLSDDEAKLYKILSKSILNTHNS